MLWSAGPSPAPSVLASDGTVAWYTDPRAVVAAGALFYSTVSGTTSGGNIELHRLRSGVRDTFLLSGELEVDDHDNASILILSTGQLACFYGMHTDSVTRCRVSLAPAPDIGGFGPEMQIAPDATKTTSYSHPFLLNDGNVYLFRRHNLEGVSGRQQQVCVDTEAALIAGTATFPTKTNILSTASQRPYAKYVQNGPDRIDCFTSKGLPGEISSACPVYHMYMKLSGGVLKYYKSDGTEITDSKPFDVATSLTLVKDSVSGTDMLWTWGIAIGADGHPRCLSTRYPSGSSATPPATLLHDIEYWHHRWTGSAWVNTRISQGNTSLYDAQTGYAPGFCFDGNDTSIIYMSENDGATGIAEIKKYSFNEAGATLALLRPITSGSANNNIRPYSPVGHDTTNALLWASGIYTTYTDYEMNAYVLGTVNDRLPTPGAYEAETEALVARMPVPPSTARKNVINRRIQRLKSGPYSGSNIWSKKALDYIFQAHDADAMLLNWKGATGDLTVTGSPTRTVNQGLKGTADGTGYLAGLAPNAIGAPFSQSDAHMSAFYGSMSGSGSAMRRITSGPPVFLATGPVGRSALLRLNTTSGFTTANVSAGNTVHHIVSRTASNAVAVYRDGGLIGANADASGALDSVALAFGYQHSSGFLRGASVGSKLTQAEAADLFFADWEYSRDARS